MSGKRMRKRGNLAYLMADLEGEIDSLAPETPKKKKAKGKAEPKEKVVNITPKMISNLNCKCPQCGEMIFFDILLNYTRCSNWRCDYRTYS